MRHTGPGLDYVHDKQDITHFHTNTNLDTDKDYLQDMINWEMTETREIAKLGIWNWTTPKTTRYVSKAQDMAFFCQKGTTVNFLRASSCMPLCIP